MPTPSLGLTYGTNEVENQNLRRLDHAIQDTPSLDDLAALQAQIATLQSQVQALDIRVTALENAVP